MSKGKKLKRKTSSASRTILRYFLIAGTVTLAATSPYFGHYLMKEMFKNRPKDPKRFSDAFYRLKKRGLIQIERDSHDVHISLTEEGVVETGKFQIDDLEISHPKKWDKKWRVVVFDISHDQRLKRDIFRRKLKELGFYSLQKSVWVHPYECKKEIKLLRDFLGLNEFNIRIIHAESIENDLYLRRVYRI